MNNNERTFVMTAGGFKITGLRAQQILLARAAEARRIREKAFHDALEVDTAVKMAHDLDEREDLKLEFEAHAAKFELFADYVNLNFEG